MTYIKKGWFLLVFLVLASCSSDELGPPRDVSYYMEHDEERNVIITKCDNDPGRLKLHPNCNNAYTARTRKMLTSGNGTGIRPPPPGYFSWPQEERDKFNKLTPEEKNRYYEEQDRTEASAGSVIEGPR